MADNERVISRHSVEDIIGILENEPVKADLFAQITAVELMNRISIAHLAIERALKFLITEAGGPVVPTHDLKDRYQDLVCYDHTSAKYLAEAFDAAVQHYRYNPNAANMRHVKTLEKYLAVVGSDKAFQNIRYWELTQSLDEALLRQAYLSLHIELLHALSEILLESDRPPETVLHRVERAVGNAIWPTTSLGYSPGTPKEKSVHSYIKWCQGFNTWGDALADAVRKNFNIGDDFMSELVRNAYKRLIDAVDPAVRYFANTLDVIPRQPRELVPCVEWLGPEKERTGSVKTPAGTLLGFIQRGPDGLWYIQPIREGLVGVSAKAKSQTDARCYLASLLTSPARVTVGGKDRSLRIVGEEYSLFRRNHDEINRRYEGVTEDDTWTHKVTFWDKDHGILVNDRLRIEVHSRASERMAYIVEGTATEVAEHEVYLSGFEKVGMAQGKSLGGGICENLSEDSLTTT